MDKPGAAARRAAHRALGRVTEERRMLTVLGDLPAPDAARAQRLALATLRHIARIDAVLDHFVSRPPPGEVQNLLRLGAAELLVDGTAPYAVVDGYVSLAKAARRTARAGGLVNAVLRRVDREARPIWDAQAPGKLPRWLRKRLLSAWGAPAVARIEAAHEAGAPLDLTAQRPTDIPGAQILPTGTIRVAEPGQISMLPGFATGDWWVQDAAAALPVRLFGDIGGARVLDLCAAPGGKTMQLAAAGADVTALDISEARLAQVRENLARTGLCARLVAADALTWRGGDFDAILLDAPCSATGTIRRHPELPLIRDGGELGTLAARQAALIDAAVGQLGPGGRLVFCTCSLLPEEGEAQLHAALKRHPDLTVAEIEPASLGGDPGWSAVGGGWRLRPDYWPERAGMDGFFMARLDRR